MRGAAQEDIETEIMGVVLRTKVYMFYLWCISDVPVPDKYIPTFTEWRSVSITATKFGIYSYTYDLL